MRFIQLPILVFVFLFCTSLFIYPPNVFAEEDTVVINEIMKNPSVVSDFKGEWFELYNNSSNTVNIDGWLIRDDGSDLHIIDNGGLLEIGADSYLVLCRNDNVDENGGVNCNYKYSGFILGNDEDEIVLLNSGQTEIDRVNYNKDYFPDSAGVSMELSSIDQDNNVGSNWHEATVTFGSGDLGTPGSLNSSSPTATPTKTPTGTQTTEPTNTPKPSATPKPTNTPNPTNTPTFKSSFQVSPTVKKSKTASNIGSVLGESAKKDIDIFLPTASPTAQFQATVSGIGRRKLPYIFFLLAGFSLIAAAYSAYKISKKGS